MTLLADKPTEVTAPAVAETAAPDVKLSAGEKDAVIRTTAQEETKPTVSSPSAPGEARAWDSQANVD